MLLCNLFSINVGHSAAPTHTHPPLAFLPSNADCVKDVKASIVWDEKKGLALTQIPPTTFPGDTFPPPLPPRCFVYLS